MPLKVGIDVSRMNYLNKTRGVGFYVKYLVEALRRFTDLEVSLVEEATTERFDVVHYPYFDLFKATLPFKKVAPTVVTIHDVIPLIFPKQYPAGLRGKINLERQKWTLKNVKAVITDSFASKNDIVRYLDFPNDKTYPIYLAQAEHFKQIKDQEFLGSLRKKYNLPEKFALFIGNVNWNKNILGIAEVAVKANIDLFMIGSSFGKKDNLDHPEMSSYKKFLETYSNQPKINILGYVEDGDLVGLLNLATVFLFPSYYEGFGLPILEAQACGTAVITGKTSSMIEVAGDSAILVDPTNVDEIVMAIKKVFNDTSLRNDLIKRGFENIKKFSWEKTAVETKLVYQKVYEADN